MWLNVPFKQESLVSELKSWCLSKLQNMEFRFAGDPSSTKLQCSSSAAEGLDEADGASLTAPPCGQGDSSQCMELQSSLALLDSGPGEPSVAEGGSANHYFVVHVESSPGISPHLIYDLVVYSVMSSHLSKIGLVFIER